MDTVAINTQSTNLTEEQFFRLCSDNRDIRFERDKFKNIIIMPPTGNWTSSNQIGIAAQLWNWNKKTKLGHVFESSAGFTLPNGAVRAPDAAWIEKKRWAKIPLNEQKRFAHICPDFVIEVRSRTDTLKMLKEKMVEWMQNGCRLGWLIDLENKKAYIYKNEKEFSEIVFSHKTISGSDVLPGFELDLNNLY